MKQNIFIKRERGLESSLKWFRGTLVNIKADSRKNSRK